MAARRWHIPISLREQVGEGRFRILSPRQERPGKRLSSNSPYVGIAACSFWAFFPLRGLPFQTETVSTVYGRPRAKWTAKEMSATTRRR